MTLPVLQRAAVHRIACSVVAAELRRLRNTEHPSAGDGEWSELTPIGDDGLGLDSMEQLGALGALAETFDLDDSLLSEGPPRAVGAWVNWIMKARVDGSGQMRVATSGSTGSPRLCTHAVADLLAEARFLATRFPCRRRVVALVPAHHMYGLIWTALLPAALDVPVVVRTIGASLGLTAGDLVIAVPVQWQALLRIIRHFPEDVVGVSSAGSLDEDLAAGLLKAGLARLVDIYGASETGGIAMRELPATTYDLLDHWDLSAVSGNDWCLVGRDGRLCALPDYLERVGERTLRLLGRRDGALQVAGHNVWPERVGCVLRTVTGVKDAAVRLHVNGRLKAFVVLDEGCDPAQMAVRIEQVITASLTDPERPKHFRFGTALPRNQMGKLADWT